MKDWKGQLMVGCILLLIGTFLNPLFNAIWNSTAELRLSVQYSKFELPPPSPDYYGANGILFIELENTGKRRATSIKLKVSNAEAVRYELEGRKKVATGSVISIAEIEPGEKIPMTIWTRYEPSEYSLQDISLTHDEGMGQIIIEQKYMGNPLWLFIKQQGIFWFLMILLLLSWIFSAYQEAKKSSTASPN